MSTQQELEVIARSQRLLQVLWIAFLFGAATYMLLGTLLVPSTDGGGGAPAMPIPLHWVFGTLAIVEIVVILLLPRFLLDPERLQAAVARGPRADQLQRAGIEAPDSRQRALIALLNQYSTTMILVWALAESIAIYGLILSFMLQNTTWLYPFGSLGLLLLALRPPRAPGFVEDHRSMLR